MQLSLVSFLTALAGGQLFYGVLSDRFGRRRPLIAGLVIFILASIGASLANTAAELIAWRFIQGAGACAAQAIPRSVVRDLHTGPSAARMMSLVLLVISIAPLLAPIVGSGMIAVLPWTSVFWFMAAVGAAALLLVLKSLPESLPPERRRRGSLSEELAGFGALLKHRQLLLLTLSIACGQASFFAYLGGSSFVFITLFGLDPWQYSLVYAFVAVGWAGAAQIAATLMTRVGEEPTARMATTIGAGVTVALLAATASGSSGLVVLTIGVWALFATLGISTLVLTVIAMHPHGHAAGMASAFIGMLTFGVGAAASALVSAFQDGTEMPMVAVMTGFAVTALLACRIALSPAPQN